MVGMTPTVVLYIGGSAIAKDEQGEILEAVDFLSDGSPDWANAGICDHRGAGGALGYHWLKVALEAAEQNAVLCGFEISRVE
jgi:hypothetical protein